MSNKRFEILEVPIGGIVGVRAKNRPSVVTSHLLERKNYQLRGVYSYKSDWDSYPEIFKLLYKIVDLGDAGLTAQSYIDLSNAEYFSKRKLQGFHKIGDLSLRDIEGLTEAQEAYDKYINHLPEFTFEHLSNFRLFADLIRTNQLNPDGSPK
jgi:hypothetical protein